MGDESCRMRFGLPSHVPPRRRSTTDHFSTSSSSSFIYETAADRKKGPTTRRSTDSSFGRRRLLDPDDFSEVFGGPPRTLLGTRNQNLSSSPLESSFYREIFRPPEKAGPGGGSSRGRSLPAFRIPAARGEGFYDDVFGFKAVVEMEEEEKGGGRSRDCSGPDSKPKSKPKSNSSSVLSSEDISPPLRQASGDDVTLSSFASKLRPINVPCRWNSTTMMPEEEPKKQEMPSIPCNRPSYSDNYYNENEGVENFRNSFIKISRQVSSPETISLGPTSHPSIKVSGDDLELNSPTSAVSSLCQEPEAKAGIHSNTMQEEEMEREEDEVMSSYVIEINSDHREGTGTGTAEAVSIDEAIAWAKEKFHSQSSDTQPQKGHSADAGERPSTQESAGPEMDGHGWPQSLLTETEILDEDIKSWSDGKETNIRLLLSTLHHILWPSSGWYAVPLTSLIENSQVKKAYQRARLCLHPDKLQQRGATFPQKYVAEKAFPILQDAWAAFISQDVFFN